MKKPYIWKNTNSWALSTTKYPNYYSYECENLSKYIQKYHAKKTNNKSFCSSNFISSVFFFFVFNFFYFLISFFLFYFYLYYLYFFYLTSLFFYYSIRRSNITALIISLFKIKKFLNLIELSEL